MGKYNSSIYRVRPLMEYLENDYDAFLSVLSLVGIDSLGKPITYRYDGVSCTEMQLKPTKRHLLALIDLMATKQHGKVSIKGRDRLDLFFGEPDVRQAAYKKARAELEAKYDTLTAQDRPWYTFEGYTNPDIFVEGDDYVIVCEGKWKEPHITTTTTYLSSAGEYRNQMIRHIQGALNYTNKKVYAFYIVDAECGYTEDLTKESFVRQLELETIRPDDMEKKKLSNAFYGYTTWQAIQEKLPQIVFRSKNDIK
ncbi:MAG: hypothetical protein IJY12_03160 [Clostridia bacterium]|nr:hypothetical protein [Clostridia bacterium]